MKFKAVARSPEPEKRELSVPERPEKLDEYKRYISWHGKCFAVPSNWLTYLTKIPENVEASNKLMGKMGMNDPFGGGAWGCGYCAHQERKILEEALSEGFALYNTKGVPGIIVEGCNYDTREIRHTSQFAARGGNQPVDAWTTPCIAYDSDLIHLARSGQLDEFEISRNDVPYFQEIKALVLNEMSKPVKTREPRKPRNRLNRLGLVVRGKIRGLI